MTTIQDLQSFYNQGNFSKCLESLNPFLLVNSDSIEALLLKAKCEYQLASLALNEDKDDNSLYLASYDSFEYVLKIEPTQEEAMLYASYINIFITQANLPEAQVYCDILALSEDEDIRLKAIGYRRHVNFILGNIDLVLKDITLMINHYQALYPNNRSILDKELSMLYLERTNIYLWHKEDAPKVFQAFNEGKAYPHNNYLTNNAVALLALDYQQFELAGEAAYMAFEYSDAEPNQELIDLYHRISALSRKNTLSKILVHSLLLALGKFSDFLGADQLETLSLSLSYIKIYPDWDIPYHFAGSFLFDAEKYEEALPYLKKSQQLGGTARGLQRYIDASCRLSGQLPDIDSLPLDSPEAYYNAGCDFYYESIPKLWTAALADELQEIKAKFYEVSYQGFYEYFYNNTGVSLANEVHTFAKCCNNYGITLTEMGAYEKAAEVHAIGYALSPFWEQLNSWGTALKGLEKYEEAIEIFQVASTYSGEYLTFPNYLRIKAEVLDMTYKLGHIEETHNILDAITNEYDSFLEVNNSNLTEEQLFELSEQYIIIQNVRHDLLSKGSPEDAIKAWQNELVKNPDDNSAWFMLMQEYYIIKDYSQCIACADNYQAVKKEAIQDTSRCKIHYMRGLSYMSLGNYEKAIEDLKALIEPLKIVYPDNEYELSRAYLHLAGCYFTLRKWDNCNEAAYEAITCYIRNNWSWDDELLKVKLQYADALRATGAKDEALENIKNILEAYPDNAEALQRKKEWKKGLFSFFK
ncbi:tetratricopeptide (TPR) repeat protein [Pedobacter cryoconitis]|uniref:tetratricopeptide repeat protein n=1 Tax=Pedobacter cryoconitis TaxID=188932 RepID=UPI00160F5BF2|nr:tetratricopeptide repeat protein [Pedobacter cryoconitis]MBB6271059.1 tetratricopeptide (TPR) repeat protein [Pedobacter cryoconitis]